jgi:predicted flap endonuclease-1-like 5' DNA nuclease
MNSTTIIIIIAVVVVIALALLFLVRGRKQHVSFDAAPPLRPVERASKPAVAPAPTSNVAGEGHGLPTEIADAVEDVIDQFVGINSHPRVEPVQGPGDTLTQLKGLGPKAASRLAELGVTRFDQIASWNETDVNAIDAQMGAFKGRIARDRWVEQARFLAKGDIVGFEAEFGKLGG